MLQDFIKNCTSFEQIRNANLTDVLFLYSSCKIIKKFAITFSDVTDNIKYIVIRNDFKLIDYIFTSFKNEIPINLVINILHLSGEHKSHKIIEYMENYIINNDIFIAFNHIAKSMMRFETLDRNKYDHLIKLSRINDKYKIRYIYMSLYLRVLYENCSKDLDKIVYLHKNKKISSDCIINFDIIENACITNNVEILKYIFSIHNINDYKDFMIDNYLSDMIFNGCSKVIDYLQPININKMNNAIIESNNKLHKMLIYYENSI